MLKHIKALLEDNAIFIAIFFTISITIGSLVKSDVIAIEIVSISDKTIHFIAYFFLMLSWFYVFFKTNRENLWCYWFSFVHWLYVLCF